MKTVLAAITFLFVILFSQDARAETLRIAFSSAPRSIDPHPFGGTPTASLKEHVFEALVASDDGPLLARSWRWISPVSLEVKLRGDVFFHNGAPFTSRDVIYSACRMMRHIDGRRNLLTNSMGPIDDIIAVDDLTVRFEFKAPYPLWIQKMKFLSILSSEHAKLQSETIAYDEHGDCGGLNYPSRQDFETGSAAIGTGPYKLDRFARTGEADLSKNDNYWGAKPVWDTVQIRTVTDAGDRLAGLIAGNFDVIENPKTEHLPLLSSSEQLTYTSVPSWRSIFIILNVSEDGAKGVRASGGNAPLADIRVRQAMSMAIDRKAITENLFLGEATVANQFAPRYRADAPNMPELPYSREKAIALLSEAGYPGGFEIDFYVPADRYASWDRVAQAVAQYLSRIGIKIHIKSENWQDFSRKRRAGDLGFFLYGWGHPQGAAQMISFAFASPNKKLGLGSANYSNYRNDQFDAAIGAWAVETNALRARTFLGAAMGIAVNDLPGIPLYYQHTIWAHRADLLVNGRQDERTSATRVSLR